MLLLDSLNAADYLRSTGRIARGEKVEVSELAGGVSNVVLYVSRAEGADFVVKQARKQLRVPEPWFCSEDRIWREVEVLRICAQALANREPIGERQGCVPEVLWEDHDEFAFGMTAIPRTAGNWKEQLLAGDLDPEVAAAAGAMLGRLHAATWHHPAIAAVLEDRRFFDSLRLDPYYRRVAQVRPELQPQLEQLIHDCWAGRHCLVHGDFSPKNLLVTSDRLWLLDCEVGHYGDPAFDVGFLLTHLTLKSFRAGRDWQRHYMLLDKAIRHYWRQLTLAAAFRAQEEENDYAGRVSRHWGACLFARLDGKSRVDYLADESRRDAVRTLARELLGRQSCRWGALRDPLPEALLHASHQPPVCS